MIRDEQEYLHLKQRRETFVEALLILCDQPIMPLLRRLQAHSVATSIRLLDAELRAYAGTLRG